MDHNCIPMSGGAHDLVDLSGAETHDTIPGSLGHDAGHDGVTQHSTHEGFAGKHSPKQHGADQQRGFPHSDAQQSVRNHSGQEYDLQHRRAHQESKADNQADASAPEPGVPAIDRAVLERLRISLERNMAELSDVCFFTMPDAHRSPAGTGYLGRNSRDTVRSLDTAADDARVIPNRPRFLVPFHVMHAVYGKPVPLQSYDNHASMPPVPVRAHAPATPAVPGRRPSRRNGSPMQRQSQASDGLRARSLEETPGRKLAAMLGRCTAALPAIGTADLLNAHKKLAKELKRRGVGSGRASAGPRASEGRAASRTPGTANHGRGKTNGSSNKKTTAEMDDPFIE